MISIDPQKVPRWLLAIAAIAAVIVVVVQMFRGDALVCADGSIFARECRDTDAVSPNNIDVTPPSGTDATPSSDIEATLPSGTDGTVPIDTDMALPSGAIVAFEDGCPAVGWEEYDQGAGRFIVGVGRHTEYDRYGKEVESLEAKQEGGHRTHRLSVGEMPAHAHEYVFSSGIHSPQYIDTTHYEFGKKDATNNTTPTGGNEPHNNMPPYIALFYCKRR